MATGKDPSFSSRKEYQKRHPTAQKQLTQAVERRLVRRQGLDRTTTGRIAKGTPATPNGRSPRGTDRDLDVRLQRAVKRRLQGS